MTLTRTLRPIGTLVAFFAACQIASAEQPGEKPFNVLFITIDDLRPELNSYAADGIKTPHIDRLASKGLQFNAAYCQYPVCNPSRSSFLTGKRPNDLGILSNRVALRSKWPDIVTLPQQFRSNGYFTAGLGKLFHAGTDDTGNMTLFRDDQSFEYFFKAMGREPAVGRKGQSRRLGDGSIKWATWRAAEGGDEAQADGLLAADAIRILEENHDRPFCVSVGFHKPHDPFIAPKEYFALYPPEDMKINSDPDDRSHLLRYALPDSYGRFRSFTDRDRREFKRAYHACTSFVDAQVGKLLATMDRLELWDNTIVILLGDHGYHLGEHGWWNKVTVFDIGARVPLVVWAPGLDGMGHQTDAVVELVDLYPTLMELSGLPAPHNLAGKSLVPVLKSPDLSWQRPAYTQVVRGQIEMGFSVRLGKWRFTQWGRTGSGGLELYNVSKDKEGYYNLVGDQQYSSEVDNLQRVLQDGFPEVTRPSR